MFIQTQNGQIVCSISIVSFFQYVNSDLYSVTIFTVSSFMTQLICYPSFQVFGRRDKEGN